MAFPASRDDQDWILYLRKSKGKAGIARQRRAAYRHVEEEIGGRIICELSDADATAYAKPGAARARRDDYLTMLTMLRRPREGKPLGVLAWHADRLHRNPVEVEDFITICATGRNPVRTVRSGLYELWTPAGRKRIRQDAVDAAYEVDHLTDRVEDSKAEAAQLGRWLGGPVPFGFNAVMVLDDDHDDGERRILVHAPEQAEAIRWAYEAVLRQVSLGEIAREWNRRGLTRHSGLPWGNDEVRRVLLRERNAGLMLHQKQIIETSVEGGVRVWELARKDGLIKVRLERGKGEWEPIVPEERWRAVVKILTDPARRVTPGPTPRWLGSGLYRCGVEGCDSIARVSSGGNGVFPDGKLKPSRPIYRCRAAGAKHLVRDAANMDAYIEAVLIARLSRPDVVNLISAQEAVDVSGLRERLRAEETHLESWRQMAESGDVEPVSFARVEKATKARIAEIKEELERAVQIPLLRELIEADDVEAYFRGQPLSWRRAVLDMLMTVTIRKARKGRLPGWRPGEPYFDADTIDIEWKRPGVSAAGGG